PRPSPRTTLFPYTTLFRSAKGAADGQFLAKQRHVHGLGRGNADMLGGHHEPIRHRCVDQLEEARSVCQLDAGRQRRSALLLDRPEIEDRSLQDEIGRASCRERVEISVWIGSLKKNRRRME